MSVPSFRLTGLVAALVLASASASGQERCREPLAELAQMMQEPEVDDVTRGKVEALLAVAEEQCEEGRYEDARIKFENARRLMTEEEGD